VLCCFVLALCSCSGLHLLAPVAGFLLLSNAMSERGYVGGEYSNEVWSIETMEKFETKLAWRGGKKGRKD